VLINVSPCWNGFRDAKLDELPHFRPASEAGSVVPDADVVLITGTTLLNNTLEKLLALCQPKARVVLVGPTVGLLPDAFLRRGVDVLGGVRVTAPDAFLDVLMEGGSAYHFFGRSAEKVVLMRRAATGKIASGVVVHPAVMRRSPDFCSIAPSSVTVPAGERLADAHWSERRNSHRVSIGTNGYGNAPKARLLPTASYRTWPRERALLATTAGSFSRVVWADRKGCFPG
jgi:hypothetical protein